MIPWIYIGRSRVDLLLLDELYALQNACHREAWFIAREILAASRSPTARKCIIRQRRNGRSFSGGQRYKAWRIPIDRQWCIEKTMSIYTTMMVIHLKRKGGERERRKKRDIRTHPFGKCTRYFTCRQNSHQHGVTHSYASMFTFAAVK